MKIVIDIPEHDYNKICETKLPKYGAMIYIIHRAFDYIKNGTPLPQNATNGDVMKIIFPDIDVYDDGNDMRVCFWIKNEYKNYYYDKFWWDTPYEAEKEREKEEEEYER